MAAVHVQAQLRFGFQRTGAGPRFYYFEGGNGNIFLDEAAAMQFGSANRANANQTWTPTEQLTMFGRRFPMKTTAPSTPLVLIADDQEDVLEALRLLLKGEGFRSETVRSAARALDAVRESEFDAALIDLNYMRDTTSGQEGLDLLARLQELDPALPVVVMTAWASIELAVETMRRGARDFIQKPWDNARLLTVLRTQVELSRTLRRVNRLEAENQLLRATAGPTLIAESPAIRRVMELVAQIAPSDVNVFLTGENGTGKGVLAQALHAQSNRRDRALVVVNMGGLSEGVFESELFGHVRGAFTDARSDRVGRFEMADHGTLFLDEIANLTLNQQARLLRVLETGEFERVGSSRTLRSDVRIVSATNADLQGEVAAGRFRQDLLFRLNTVTIHLPPLRERREDIPVLADYFLQQHARRYRKSLGGFEPAALQLLQQHAWPGNVRELDHAVERAALLAKGRMIKPADLALHSGAETAPRIEDMSLEEVERFLIRKTLARFDGNPRQAAEALGLSRSAFYRRLEKHGL
jgi:DNA-binding NtrC family response regulator